MQVYLIFFFNCWSKKNPRLVFLGLIAIFCDTLHNFFIGLSNYNFKMLKIKIRICMYSFNDFVET